MRGERGELGRRRGMFRRTAVDDDTTEDRAVSADPFRRAVGDDVCTVVEGPDKVPWKRLLDTHIHGYGYMRGV